MRTPVAFVDANVLLSKTLREWLFLLRAHTNGGLFVLFSSENVFAEERLAVDLRELLRVSMDDIVADYPAGPDLPGADERDSGIHAAALASNAIYVIVEDGRYAEVDTDNLAYEVHTADSFFMLVAANAARAVDDVILEQFDLFRGIEGSKRPDLALEDAGCPEFAKCVLKHMQSMFKGESTQGIADALLLGAARS
ncbi:hypothetical protein GCM10010458_27000 [Microbacterium luteolum]|uniref:PIN domain-containing protein n=1 Tax=Microbacterium luteolum TaxID=69367 RepID=A0ABY7XT02_MICLT|nr:hypothetical protein [Microbacterium luteolum]WDM45315.1 hypothetical protein KV395_19590 [Microbacterium luteolum]